MKIFIDQSIFHILSHLPLESQGEINRAIAMYPNNDEVYSSMWPEIKKILDDRSDYCKSQVKYVKKASATRWNLSEEVKVETRESNPFILLTKDENIQESIRNPNSSISQFIENGSCYDELTYNETEFVNLGEVRKLFSWNKKSHENIDKKAIEKPSKKFVPPTKEEWESYCQEKSLDNRIMANAYESYSVADWKDSYGKPIKNWKQKILQVWCNKSDNFSNENKRKRPL